jgi:hypothetical protein
MVDANCENTETNNKKDGTRRVFYPEFITHECVAKFSPVNDCVIHNYSKPSQLGRNMENEQCGSQSSSYFKRRMAYT